MGGEKKLVRRVADLMQADRNMQLLDAVEKVMDEVDYDDTMTVDEVAELVEKERQHRKEVAKDAGGCISCNSFVLSRWAACKQARLSMWQQCARPKGCLAYLRKLTSQLAGASTASLQHDRMP